MKGINTSTGGQHHAALSTPGCVGVPLSTEATLTIYRGNTSFGKAFVETTDSVTSSFESNESLTRILHHESEQLMRTLLILTLPLGNAG